MNTKTCSGCGWVFPSNVPYESCPFCKTRFIEYKCKACGVDIPELINNAMLCKACYAKGQEMRKEPRKYLLKNDGMTYKARYNKKRRDAATKRYNDWLEVLKNTKMHTLTEDEWLEACRYFNGCALCNSSSIDARGYFVPFEEGGKYMACNVIPICETCASDIKYQPNPFIRYDEKLNRNLATVRGLSLDKIYNIMEYLQSKLEDNKDE